jgi:hypothetical protein
MLTQSRAPTPLSLPLRGQRDPMKPIHQVFPGSWADMASAIKGLREQLYGEDPPIDPVDISDIAVPERLLSEIKEKNLRCVRDNISLEELTAEDSPYRTDAFFDDQLLEVLGAIANKYHPIAFILQLIRFVEIFLNLNAAFQGGLVDSRIKDDDADRVTALIREAAERAKDEDTKRVLQLLLVDVTNGGDAPWTQALSPNEREYLEAAMRKVG